MNSLQDRLVTLALILSETVWLYAVYASIGILIGLGRSPISWAVCLAMYSASLYLSRGIGLFKINSLAEFLLQMVGGVVLAYFLVGISNVPDGTDFSKAWIAGIKEWDFDQGEPVLCVILAFAMSAISWMRGGFSGAADFPMQALMFSFRIGIMVLAITVTLDMFHPAELHLNMLMLLFFASSLGGMAIGRIMPAQGTSMNGSKWAQVIAVLIVAVVSLGALFSALGHNFLLYISRPIITVLSWIGTVIIYVIVFPIAYLVEFIIKGLRWLIGEPTAREEPQVLPSEMGLGDSFQQLMKEAEEKQPSIFIEIFEAAAIFIGVIGLLAIFAFAFRRRVKWGRRPLEKDRSSLSQGVNPLEDMLRLAKSLIPGFGFRRSSPKYRIPDTVDEGSREILMSYYEMLDKGNKKGVERKLDTTPHEIVPVLSNVLAPQSVIGITELFVCVCYGSITIGLPDVAKAKEMLNNLEIVDD